ncbi:MAG: UbiA prenyltransferase family protein [Solirubrobacteraceae bacterium]
MAPRPAFYAVGRGRMGDVLTLLHPPYTLWHLSYYALGAAVAPHLHVSRLLWGLAAFALAVGVAAHVLDELHDRPLRTGFSDGALRAAAIVSLLGAVAIGVVGVLTISVWLAPLVLAGALFLPAYNLELAGGRFHSDLWFAVGWGAFPAFTGYFANAQEVGVSGLLMAVGATAMSVAQRRLSSPARELRRRTASVSGQRTRSDGSSEALSVERLLAPLDGALAALSLAIVVTACAVVVTRL